MVNKVVPKPTFKHELPLWNKGYELVIGIDEVVREAFVLVDGFHIKFIRKISLKNQKAIIKGDQKSLSIASASIIAKVYRDNLMCSLDKTYPGYQFKKHKGYGTFLHRTILKSKGISKVHRTSFTLHIAA